MAHGRHLHIIDAKSRIAFPAPFRQEFGEKFIITRMAEKCLHIFSIEDWNKIEGKTNNSLFLEDVEELYIRNVIGSAYDIELDCNGRFVLPKFLIEFAGIVKNVVSIGCGNRIEVWSKEVLVEYEKNNLFDKDKAKEAVQYWRIN